MNRQQRVTSGIPERVILATLWALVMGCSGERGAGPETIDSVQLELDFGGGVTLTSVDYDLTGPNSFHQTGTLPVGSSDTVTGMFGSLPAGKGYDVRVSGTASDGSSTCTGETVFNVPSPTIIQIHLMCSGRASLSGTINVCPRIDNLSVAPSEVYVGSSMQLTLEAHDPDNGPAVLTAAWSSVPPGTLTNLSTAGATFTCTTAGSFTVSVSVDDGEPGMQCIDSASVNVVCTTPPGGP
jgi:hypothetical protein